MSRALSFFFQALLCSVLLGAVGCESVEPVSPGYLSRGLIQGKRDLRFPGIGALSLDKQGKFCTATLIAPRIVLTAGHCISAVQGGLRNQKKAYFRVDWPDGTGFRSEYHEVAVAQPHPNYNLSKTGIYDDVGVLILKKALQKPAPLPLNFQPLTPSWIGKTVLFLGYGLIQTQPSRKSTNHKMSLEIPLHQLLKDRFATLGQGKSICTGDSGGPALAKFGKSYRVIGVNSYVTGGTDPGGALCNGAGVSFRTDNYFSWLDPLLKRFGFVCSDDADCGVCHACSGGACQPRGLQHPRRYCQPCRDDKDCGDSRLSCVRTSAGKRCLQSCLSDRCCPAGSSCQTVDGRRLCAPANALCPQVSCSEVRDCGPAEQCKGGKCAPAQVQPSPSFCKPCVQSGECGGGVCKTYTSGGACTMPCASDLFCPAGSSCKVVPGKPRRQCLPDKGVCPCEENRDCHRGYVCTRGVCKLPGGGKTNQPCDNTSQTCAEGYSCLKLNGAPELRCVRVCRVTEKFPAGSPGSACRKGDFCDHNSTCTRVRLNTGTLSLCLKNCSSAADCREGGSCARAGANSPPLCVCFSDEDCKQGFSCNRMNFGNFGFCARPWKPTQQEIACPRLHACQEVGPGIKFCNQIPCTGGDDCEQGERCRGGLCVKAPEPRPEPVKEPAQEKESASFEVDSLEPVSTEKTSQEDAGASLSREPRKGSEGPPNTSSACGCAVKEHPQAYGLWWLALLLGAFRRRTRSAKKADES